MRLYDYIAQNEGIACTIVHSLDGYDEISLTSSFKVANSAGQHVYTPESLGWDSVNPDELSGGDTIADAAAVFDRVLRCEATKAQHDCVVANATFAIKTLNPLLALNEAREQAEQSLASGAALHAFTRFVELNS
jgi:anthranilate phosphoribosyltransferase